MDESEKLEFLNSCNIFLKEQVVKAKKEIAQEKERLEKVKNWACYASECLKLPSGVLEPRSLRPKASKCPLCDPSVTTLSLDLMQVHNCPAPLLAVSLPRVNLEKTKLSKLKKKFKPSIKVPRMHVDIEPLLKSEKNGRTLAKVLFNKGGPDAIIQLCDERTVPKIKKFDWKLYEKEVNALEESVKNGYLNRLDDWVKEQKTKDAILRRQMAKKSVPFQAKSCKISMERKSLEQLSTTPVKTNESECSTENFKEAFVPTKHNLQELFGSEIGFDECQVQLSQFSNDAGAFFVQNEDGVPVPVIGFTSEGFGAFNSVLDLDSNGIKKENKAKRQRANADDVKQSPPRKSRRIEEAESNSQKSTSEMKFSIPPTPENNKLKTALASFSSISADVLAQQPFALQKILSAFPNACLAQIKPKNGQNIVKLVDKSDLSNGKSAAFYPLLNQPGLSTVAEDGANLFEGKKEGVLRCSTALSPNKTNAPLQVTTHAEKPLILPKSISPIPLSPRNGYRSPSREIYLTKNSPLNIQNCNVRMRRGQSDSAIMGRVSKMTCLSPKEKQHLICDDPLVQVERQFSLDNSAKKLEKKANGSAAKRSLSLDEAKDTPRNDCYVPVAKMPSPTQKQAPSPALNSRSRAVARFPNHKRALTFNGVKKNNAVKGNRVFESADCNGIKDSENVTPPNERRCSRSPPTSPRPSKRIRCSSYNESPINGIENEIIRNGGEEYQSFEQFNLDLEVYKRNRDNLSPADSEASKVTLPSGGVAPGGSKKMKVNTSPSFKIKVSQLPTKVSVSPVKKADDKVVDNEISFKASALTPKGKPVKGRKTSAQKNSKLLTPDGHGPMRLPDSNDNSLDWDYLCAPVPPSPSIS